MRIAALDVGSRSFHVLIASLQSGNRFSPVASMKEVVRLADDLSTFGEISDAKMEIAAAALVRLRHFAQEHEAKVLLAMGTSAVREAKNCGRFLTEMRRRAGVDITPISEHEEARLVHLAIHQRLPAKRLSCVVDVGGGSVELALATAGHFHRSVSFPFGVQRLAARYPAHEGLSPELREGLRAELYERLEPFLEEARRRGVQELFLTGGSMRALHSAARSTDDTLRFSALCELERAFASSTPQTLISSHGVAVDRAETAAVSAIIAKTVFELLGLDGAAVCMEGLREGIISDYQRRFGRATIVGGL